MISILNQIQMFPTPTSVALRRTLLMLFQQLASGILIVIIHNDNRVYDEEFGKETITSVMGVAV